MSGPQIKKRLESPQFTSSVSPAVRKRLQDCLDSDPAHIQPHDRGDHVKVRQEALETLRQRLPDLGLVAIKDKPGEYEDDTITRSDATRTSTPSSGPDKSSTPSSAA